MDALDTLLIAGLDSEVADAEQWLITHFNVNNGRVLFSVATNGCNVAVRFYSFLHG